MTNPLCVKGIITNPTHMDTAFLGRELVGHVQASGVIGFPTTHSLAALLAAHTSRQSIPMLGAYVPASTTSDLSSHLAGLLRFEHRAPIAPLGRGEVTGLGAG